MSRLSRLTLVGVVLGGMLAFFGFQEWRVSRGSTAEPLAVELAEVEAGRAPENNHWKLGECVALYSSCVYEYEQSKYSTAEPDGETKINHCYYPVISKGHPFLSQLSALAAKHGSVEAIPESEVPALNNFAVLVKSRQFKQLGDIPADWDVAPATQGLVINRIASLDKKEAELLRQGFPGQNTDKLLLLEADRRPASILKSGGMMGGGALLALGAIALMVAKRNG
jgi:hypothetical protein